MAVFAMNYWEAYFLMVLEYRGLPWGSVGWNAAVSRAGPLSFHLCSLVSDWQHSSAWGPITPASASFITAPFPTLDSCFFIRKYLCNWISTNSMFWINQNKAPHVKIFNTIIFIKSLLPYKAILKVLGGPDMDTLGHSHFSSLQYVWGNQSCLKCSRIYSLWSREIKPKWHKVIGILDVYGYDSSWVGKVRKISKALFKERYYMGGCVGIKIAACNNRCWNGNG